MLFVPPQGASPCQLSSSLRLSIATWLATARRGSRTTRGAAARIVTRLAVAAGIDKHLTPHSLRHSAITAALNAGVALRDVQEFARHAARQADLILRTLGQISTAP
jgi:site-specific recombinase XerD